MDAVLLEEKRIFVELLAEDPESLQKVVDQINEKHNNAINDIMDLRDKKLEEIEEAYAKYRENHAQAGVYQRQQSDIDVTQSMHMGEEE